MPSCPGRRPLQRRDTASVQYADQLGLLPTDLLFEIFESAKFESILLLTQTCKRLRTIDLAWILRHYRLTGICAYGEEIRLTSGNEYVLAKNIAAITHLSIHLSISFRCAADFNGKWKALETLVIALPGLTSFTCQLDPIQRYPSSITAWYHKRLFKRFWWARLAKKDTVVITNTGHPSILRSLGHQDPILDSLPCLAHKIWPRRFASATRHQGKQATFNTLLAAKKAWSHLAGTDKFESLPSRLNLQSIEDYCPSITLKNIETPSKRFVLFLPGRERFTRLRISSNHVSYLDWSAILPGLDFPALSSLEVHQKCHGLTRAVLHDFIFRHPTITELVLTRDDHEMITPDTFQGCLPKLKTLAGSIHAVVAVLRGADSGLCKSLNTVKITEFHSDTSTTRRHRPFDFAALDTALDLLSSTSMSELGIGLPGGSTSMTWLTEQPSQGNHVRKFESLESVYVWSSDCRPFDDNIPHWLEEYRQRNFPGVEKVHLVMHRTKAPKYPLPLCLASSGSHFKSY